MKTLQELCHILEEISNTKGINAKRAMLKEADCGLLRSLLVLGFDPYITFGVQLNEAEVLELPVTAVNCRATEFNVLTKNLSTRVLTGNAARIETERVIGDPDPTVRKWMLRIINKNMKMGVSNTSINKDFPNLLRDFKVQLAKAITDERLDNNWTISRKYDGFRCFMIFEKGKCTKTISRNGRELFNVSHIVEELEEHFKGRALNFVLDGELMGDSWNDTASAARASKSDREQKMFLHLIDLIPYKEWVVRKGELKLIDRLDIIDKLFPKEMTYLKKIENVVINSTEEAWEYAKKYLDEGYEGAVVKDLNSVYAFDRSDDWLKLKFTDTVDLKVCGVTEGRGDFEGMLGALICKLDNSKSNGSKKTINIGGGFKKQQRIDLWAIKDQLIDKTVEVKYQSMTPDGSYLFPVFKKFREDK